VSTPEVCRYDETISDPFFLQELPQDLFDAIDSPSVASSRLPSIRDDKVISKISII
jgi:hypothetical protein